MLDHYWRRLGSGILAGLLLSVLVPITDVRASSVVEAGTGIVRGSEVCGISVRGLSYSDAVELENNGFLYGKDYTYDKDRKMYVPTRKEIRDGLGNMFMTLQMYGVDVNQVVDDALKYSVVRADMKGILGHAFVWQDKPEIYLYGKYIDFWDGMETEATIIHEFGHYVEAKYMSDMDRRIEYAKLRGLPKDMVYMTQDGADWGDLFEEIFAEDYKTLFVDGSLYKANQKPLSVAKREKLRDLIVGWMVSDLDPSREVSKELTILRDSGVVSDGDVLFCEDQATTYLREGVSGSDLVNWLVEMYYSKSERVGKMLTTRDIDRDINMRYGFYPSDVTTLSAKRYGQIVNYFTSKVDGYVIGRYDKNMYNTKRSVYKKLGSGYSDYTKSVLGSSVYYRLIEYNELKNYRNGKITRGELAYWLRKSNGAKKLSYAESRDMLKGYKDVDVTSRYGRDVATAIKNKWMYGVKVGSFGYGNNVSKEQASYLLGKVYKNRDLGGKVSNDFNDVNKVNRVYKKEVLRLKNSGVLLGDSDGKFNPKQDITRTQWLGMLTRLRYVNTARNIRNSYSDDRLLSIYGVQQKLRNGYTSDGLIKKSNVIKWLK